MSKAEQAPGGILILAWAHIMVGGVVSALLLAGIAASVFAGNGIPVEMLVPLLVMLGLGVGLGTGMILGKPPAWYLASVGHFLVLVLGLFLLASMLIGLVGGPADPGSASGLAGTLVPLNVAEGLAYAVLVLGILVALLAWAYLFTRGAREHFGLAGRAIRRPLAAQLAVGLVLVLAATLQVRRIESTQSVARLRAIGESGLGQEGRDLDYMQQRLRDGNTEERVVAAWALGRSGRAEAFQSLQRAAREDPAVDVRVSATGALAELGGENTEAALVEILADQVEDVQAAALKGLAREEFREAAGTVGELLLAGSDNVRIFAADVLGEMGNRDAVPVLVRAAQDPLENVRSRVAFALGKLGDRRAVPALITMLEDQEWEARANAAQALGMIGDVSAFAALEPLLTDPNTQVRTATQRALRKLQ